MNRILIALNIVLLAAVGFLYFLYIKYTVYDQRIHDVAAKRSADSFKVAYFDIDTLDTYYDYSKQVRSSLMQQDSINQGKLAAMRNNINSQIKQMNQTGGSLTQQQQISFQQKMQDLQNEYESTGNTLAQQLQAESYQKLQQVRVKIQKFLKEYCQQKGYAYVLGTQEYDNMVYYKDTIRNITADLVAKLNMEFRSEQKK
jgi:outer membrane protein